MENANLKAFGLQNSLKFVIVAIIAIALVIAVIIIFSVNINEESPTQGFFEEEVEFDNRISPLVNQGLILEVKRIRNRVLLDEIMNFGISWRKTPQFKVEIEIDGMKYSKETNYDFSFNTWDTWFQEFRVIRDTVEEPCIPSIKRKIVVGFL
jgi:hypothetical protein